MNVREYFDKIESLDAQWARGDKEGVCDAIKQLDDPEDQILMITGICKRFDDLSAKEFVDLYRSRVNGSKLPDLDAGRA